MSRVEVTPIMPGCKAFDNVVLISLNRPRIIVRMETWPERLMDLVGDEPPHRQVAALVSRAVGGEACLFDLNAPGEAGAMGRTFGEVGAFTEPERLHVARWSLFSWRGDDEFAFRPVSQVRILARTNPGGVRSLKDAVLGPHGFADERRVTLYDGGRFIGHLSCYRPGRCCPFGPAQRRVLLELAPHVAALLALQRIVRGAGPQRAWATAILSDDDRPAWLLGPGGALLHANEAALRLGEFRLALAQAVRDVESGRACAQFRLVPLTGEGGAWYVARLQPEARRPSAWPLPDWLVPVATGVARGLSDKEIAEQVSLPIRTVRTATARIYSRLGVHSRAELTRYAAARGLLPV